MPRSLKDLGPPKELAKWFINRIDRDAGEAITHLKVQKLLYFAQAYHLANYNRQLFAEDMEAWAHGPVVPSVFQVYRDSRWESLPPTSPARVDKALTPYLDTVYQHFAKFSAKELERLTHAHKPWRVTRKGLPLEARCNDPIDKKLIRDFYAERIKKGWGAARIRA